MSALRLEKDNLQHEPGKLSKIKSGSFAICKQGQFMKLANEPGGPPIVILGGPFSRKCDQRYLTFHAT